MNEYTIKPIARMKSDFPSKFGIPRQAGIVKELESAVIFEKDYRNSDALRGLEGFSHIWIIWRFSEVPEREWSPTVRPPRLGGNERMGVFATRSPFRPNALGLSCVKLLRIENDRELGPVLYVSGADLMDGTPIFDIKPYLPYADCIGDAEGGFAPDSGATLRVKYMPGTEESVPDTKRAALRKILENDPRPRYSHDSQKTFGLTFAGINVRFTVDGDELTVTEISPV